MTEVLQESLRLWWSDAVALAEVPDALVHLFVVHAKRQCEVESREGMPRCFSGRLAVLLAGEA